MLGPVRVFRGKKGMGGGMWLRFGVLSVLTEEAETNRKPKRLSVGIKVNFREKRRKIHCRLFLYFLSNVCSLTPSTLPIYIIQHVPFLLSTCIYFLFYSFFINATCIYINVFFIYIYTRTIFHQRDFYFLLFTSLSVGINVIFFKNIFLFLFS